MRRRAFIGLLTGAIGWPLIARAQPSSAMPHVVQLGPVEIPAQIAATKRLLAELGYVEGRIRLEFRHAAGDADALPALAQEIVRDGRVDVIIAISTPAALAATRQRKQFRS